VPSGPDDIGDCSGFCSGTGLAAAVCVTGSRLVENNAGSDPVCQAITPVTRPTTITLKSNGIRIEGRFGEGFAAVFKFFVLAASGATGADSVFLTELVGIADPEPAVNVFQPLDSAHAISSAPTKLEQFGYRSSGFFESPRRST
jgi:hypothetical protein